ncbi:MAG: hypothetical protein MJZ07_04775 [Bacteroidales bacterium]|nr:hypothetical protein [Bacteroidales bacterium]
MKKILTILAIALGISAAAVAQPKAIGGRLGYQTEVSYQHYLGNPNFLEVTAGFDFNSLAQNDFGFLATATYNFTFAQPNWTDRGTWAWYAGPGIATGWVNDKVVWKPAEGVKEVYHPQGFMIGLAGQVGLSYTFWFPLQLSVSLRPVVGMHISAPVKEKNTGAVIVDSKANFYDGGVTWNWTPTLSVHYAF